MEMEKRSGRRAHEAHVLLLPYPSQGHINPMLQFGKRLVSHGLRATIAITRFIAKSTPSDASSVRVEQVSDGYDAGGFSEADSIEGYLERFRTAGSATLADLIEKQSARGCPVDCLVYDAFLPWALDVAKGFGLVGATFFTQSCAVNAVYYHVYHGRLAAPSPGPTVSIQGLPELELSDAPSFISEVGIYPAYLALVVNQFSNLEKADLVFINTFYELEVEVAEWMATVYPARTIGPTVPSMYLDKRVEGDGRYGFDLFTPEQGPCIEWLDSQEAAGSVVYVSFGSLSALGPEQMEELAWGLRGSNKKFLWVVRATEESKLPGGFMEEEEEEEKGLVVRWSPQLEVLAHRAVGCFVTHCGWNSTLEGLSLGVPMVGVPQWTDQPTNAKYVADVWGVGVRARADERGVVRREEVEFCVRQVMEGERGEEIRNNARRWKELAREAADEGGSSDKSIAEFAAGIINQTICVK